MSATESVRAAPPSLSLALRRIHAALGRMRAGAQGRAGHVVVPALVPFPFCALEELRRFAPSVLADRIERGQGIDAGERQVSVLFADLRDYAAYADRRRPREVFDVLSRYAKAFTRVVSQHGGHVVEFGGDGVMAVFGAPEEMPAKERSALEAARGICRIAPRLAEGGPPAGGSRLSAGVGIATGEAFVGGIRAGNRTFWSAVGSTTNLAARLQQLTRELECAVAVDVRTWRGAGSAGAGLECRQRVRIRGHSQPEDVYVLPLGAA